MDSRNVEDCNWIKIQGPNKVIRSPGEKMPINFKPRTKKLTGKNLTSLGINKPLSIL